MSDLSSYNPLDSDSTYLSNQISDKSSSFSTDGSSDIDTSKMSNWPTEFSSSLPTDTSSDGSSSDLPSNKPTELPNSDIKTSNNILDTSNIPTDSINTDLKGKTDLHTEEKTDNLNYVITNSVSDKTPNPTDSSLSEKIIPTDSRTEKKSDLPSSETSHIAIGTNSVAQILSSLNKSFIFSILFSLMLLSFDNIINISLKIKLVKSILSNSNSFIISDIFL